MAHAPWMPATKSKWMPSGAHARRVAEEVVDVRRVGPEARQRPRPAVARHRQHHQVGVARSEIRIGAPPRLHGARAQVLQHDVRPSGQLPKGSPTALVRHVETGTAQAAGHPGEQGRRPDPRWLDDLRPPGDVVGAQRLRAVLRLDLDDVRSELGQHQGTDVPGDEGAERQDADASEGLGLAGARRGHRSASARGPAPNSPGSCTYISSFASPRRGADLR